MQAERASASEAGSRKAKRWGLRCQPDRASEGDPQRSGKPGRASQGAQGSQIEPATAFSCTGPHFSSQPGCLAAQGHAFDAQGHAFCASQGV